MLLLLSQQWVRVRVRVTVPGINEDGVLLLLFWHHGEGLVIDVNDAAEV